MKEGNFNRRQCVRSLLKIGFVFPKKRHGGHDKFISPIPGSNPPFIMIPRHNELYIQKTILEELRRMGGETLVENFLDNL